MRNPKQRSHDHEWKCGPPPEDIKGAKTQFGCRPYSNFATILKNCPGTHPEHSSVLAAIFFTDTQFHSEYIQTCLTFICFLVFGDSHRPNTFSLHLLYSVCLFLSLLPQRSRLAGLGHFASLNDSVWVQERTTPVTFAVYARLPVPT